MNLLCCGCCFQIKKKYPYPSVPERETDFPEGLAKFITRQGFFKRGSVRDGQLDPDTFQTIGNMSRQKHFLIPPVVIYQWVIPTHPHPPTSLFQGAVCLMLDASRQGPTVHLLQEVSGCQAASHRSAGTPLTVLYMHVNTPGQR